MSKYSHEAQQAWAAYWDGLKKYSGFNMPASVHFGAGFKAGSELCETLANLTVQAESEYEKIRDQRDALLAMLKEGLPLAVGMGWKEQAQLLIDEIERK